MKIKIKRAIITIIKFIAIMIFCITVAIGMAGFGMAIILILKSILESII